MKLHFKYRWFYILGLLLTSIYFLFVYEFLPYQTAISNANHEINTLKDAIIHKKNLSVSSQVESVSLSLNELQTMIANSLIALSATQGLSIKQLKFLVASHALTLSMKLSGHINNRRQFLQKLLQLNFIFKIVSLQLNEANDALNFNLIFYPIRSTQARTKINLAFCTCSKSTNSTKESDILNQFSIKSLKFFGTFQIEKQIYAVISLADSAKLLITKAALIGKEQAMVTAIEEKFLSLLEPDQHKQIIINRV